MSHRQKCLILGIFVGIITSSTLEAQSLKGFPIESMDIIKSLPANLPGSPQNAAADDSSNLPSDPGQAVGMVDMSQEPIINSSAVEDITNKPPGWADSLFQRGSPLHFGLTAGETYDDNIFISPQKSADFLTHLSPNLDLELGDKTATNSNYLNLYLAPTIFLYEKHTDQDRQDYDADFYYQYQWTRLTLGIEQQYQHLTDASIDIGNLATRDIYTTNLSGNYVYNDKLTAFATATQRITNFSTQVQVNTNEWILDSYAQYQFAPKLALGLGPLIDFIDISGAPNENHEDLLFHLSYNPGGKINVILAGGLEYLQYQGPIPSHLLPIFNLTANYTPLDGTTLTLSAYRESVTSYDLGGETYLNTSVQGSVRQRFIRDFYLTLSAGYSISDYEFGSEPVDGQKRNDDYYFANAGLEWDPREWLKISATYERSQDHSTVAQNSFDDNQIDIQVSAHF